MQNKFLILIIKHCFTILNLLKNMKKRFFCILSHGRFWYWSGFAFGSVCQRYGFEVPDPHPDSYQNVTDPEQWPTTPLLWVTWRYRWSAGSSLRQGQSLPRTCRHHFPGIRHSSDIWTFQLCLRQIPVKPTSLPSCAYLRFHGRLRHIPGMLTHNFQCMVISIFRDAHVTFQVCLRHIPGTLMYVTFYTCLCHFPGTFISLSS